MTVTCQACRRERAQPREMPAGVATPPNAGDFWICPWCGALHRFHRETTWMGRRLVGGVGPLTVHQVGDDELSQLDDELRADLEARRERIRAGEPFAGRGDLSQ